MFLCGTGVQISPVIEIDHRPIGSGEVGPIGQLVRDRYFDAVRGRLPEYSHWLTEIATCPSPDLATPGSAPDHDRRLPCGSTRR